MLYSRQESLLFHPKRHATVIRIRTGAKRDGRLTAVQATLYGDGGAYASLSEKVLTRATTHASGPYDVPHVKVDCFAALHQQRALRCIPWLRRLPELFRGGKQHGHTGRSNWAWMPSNFAAFNALDVGSMTCTGQIMRESVGLIECIDKIDGTCAAIHFAGPGKKVHGATPGVWRSATRIRAWVAVHRTRPVPKWRVWLDNNGQPRAEVRTSSAEMGQGLPAVLAACVAEELDIPRRTASGFCSATRIIAPTVVRPLPAGRLLSAAMRPASRQGCDPTACTDAAAELLVCASQ